MIIKLGNYNEGRELHIGDGTTGSQAQVSYRDKVRRTSMTRAAVHMEVEKTGMQAGYRNAYNSFRVGIENRYACWPCRAIRKALAHPKIKIDRRKRGWDSQVPGPPVK